MKQVRVELRLLVVGCVLALVGGGLVSLAAGDWSWPGRVRMGVSLAGVGLIVLGFLVARLSAE